MGWAERAMAGEEKSGSEAAQLFQEHVALMGRVAMALAGDGAVAERALETVARELGAAARLPDKPRAWLLGRVRAACAVVQTSRPADAQVRTERLGASDAIAARGVLATLRPTEREALVLRLVGGLDTNEIAFACNIDEATARKRVNAGLAAILKAEGK
jgi:DNA-directed RNA polymerase specialized sigma24 family protein